MITFAVLHLSVHIQTYTHSSMEDDALEPVKANEYIEQPGMLLMQWLMFQ